MVITMKGIFRGLKIIAQIFTVQREHEHEIEIGYPTDVRHLSHVGFSASGSCPSWSRGGSSGTGIHKLCCPVEADLLGFHRQVAPHFEQPVVGVSLPPPAEASTAASTTRGAAKRPAARLKKARGSSARSSSWRSTGSFATTCNDSGELRPAGLRAA
nr:unnamed protein product [Digitaria exilis]